MSRSSFNFTQMDYQKAQKYIMLGFLIAIIAIAVMFASQALAANAQDWADFKIARLGEEVNWGVITDNDRDVQVDAINFWVEIMETMQASFIDLICNFIMYVALAFVFIGFVGLAFTGTGDEKTRRFLLMFAAFLLFLMIFALLFPNWGFSLNVGP